MNRVQLVQVIIIITAMILGYQMLNSFAVFTSSAFTYFALSGGSRYDFTIYYGVLSLLYAISLFVLINNISKISNWIIEKVQPDENIQLSFSDTSVLYAILLFLTLSTLLKNIPAIVYDLFQEFSEKVSPNAYNKRYSVEPAGINWSRIIETIIAFVLLIKMKPVVHYFQQKIDPHDPHYISDAEPNRELE